MWTQNFLPKSPWSCLLTLFVGIGFFCSDVFACRCAPPPPPADALAEAHAVFLAEVVGIATIKETGLLKVTMRVARWWKGGDKSEVTVQTSSSGARCGYGFQKSGKYLVYAHSEGKDGVISVSRCSRTRTDKEADASGDFGALGEGKEPAN